MKKLFAFLAFLAFLASPAHAQSVRQSGNITPGHIASWVTTGVIADGGPIGGGATLNGTFTANDFVCANASGSAPSLIDCGLSATGTNNWAGVQNFQGVATAVTQSAGDNSIKLATTAYVDRATTTALPLPQNDIFVGNASNFAAGVAMAGDCTIIAAGTITCTKTNGVAFAASATTDTTSASNISSGTLPLGRLSGITTSQLSATAGIVGTQLATNTVAFSNITQGGAFAVICNPTSGTANLQACTPTQVQANIFCAPQISVFLSGSSATYSTPTCNSLLPLYLELEAVGGGGSGAGSGTSGNNGSNGNNSTIVCNAVTYTGSGGSQGTNGGASQAGGAGGTATNGDENITGGTGSASPSSAAAVQIGGPGGGSTLGGAGPPGTSTAAAGAAAANTGSGGGSSGTAAAVAGGSGGGAGGTMRKLLTSPPSSCTYTVGAATTGGTGGTSGQNGGGGAAGRVKFVARWQ